MSDMNELPHKPKRRWIPIVLGIVFLLFVLDVGGVLLSVAWFRQALRVPPDVLVTLLAAGNEVGADRLQLVRLGLRARQPQCRRHRASLPGLDP